MKNRLLFLLLACIVHLGAMADEVAGLTVEYVAPGSQSYVQAISAIGRIEFKSGKATLVFKDADAGTEDLGAISSIKRISFGNVDDIIIDDTPTAIVAEEHKVCVSAYPNPTADHVHISGMAEGHRVRLFTSDGRLTYVGTSADVDLGGMPSGVYLLQVGKEVIKIIKK